jgi:hypothetical protein
MLALDQRAQFLTISASSVGTSTSVSRIFTMSKLLGLYALPAASGDVTVRKKMEPSVVGAPQTAEIETPREGAPPKSREAAFSGQHSPVGRKYREDHHAHHRVARPCDRERRRDDCLGKEGARSVGLRGAELLMIRPARVVMCAAVFTIGVVTGAGIAAWMMPPI